MPTTTKPTLLPCEVETLQLFAEGLNYTEISLRRRTWPKATTNNLWAARKKLGVKSNVEAVEKALELEILARAV